MYYLFRCIDIIYSFLNLTNVKSMYTFFYEFVKQNIFTNRKSTVSVDNNKIIIEYMFNNKIYKILVPEKKISPPKKYKLIKDENGNDITQIIEMLMGPGKNFHKLTYTPHDLGLKQVIFVNIIDDGEVIYEEEDILSYK